MILEYMKEFGFDDETIAKVYTPIGISIHAETPQEIAISIVAELIKVRGEQYQSMDDLILDEHTDLIEKVEEGSLPTPFDPLRKYLAEVSKYPVLSREGEKIFQED